MTHFIKRAWHIVQNKKFQGKGISSGQKGFIAGVQYVPAENILATVQYFTGEDSYEDGDNDAEKIFSQIEFFFW